MKWQDDQQRSNLKNGLALCELLLGYMIGGTEENHNILQLIIAGFAVSNSLNSSNRFLSFEFAVCCVGSGLCNELITFGKESNRVSVSNCVVSRYLNN